MNAPESAPAPLQTVLGELLRAVSFRAEVFFRGKMCDDWALDTSGKGFTTFHAIGAGGCWLHLRSLPAPRRLEPGDVVILPHDHQHSITPTADTEPHYGGKRYTTVLPLAAEAPGVELLCGYIHMPPTAHDLLMAAVPDHLVAGRGDPQGQQLGRLADALFEEARQQSPAATAVVEKLADALLVKTFEMGVAGLPEPAGFYAGLAHPRIGRAIAAAWAEPAKPWTVGSLAEVAAMSRSTFAEHFVRLVGKSPMDVITAWRMQLARTALERGRISVADVAQQVGYEAEAAFRKAFKRHFGFGPGEARRG